MNVVEKCHFCGSPEISRSKYDARFSCGTVRPIDADERRGKRCLEIEAENKVKNQQ